MTAPPPRVAWIGLGQMGRNMAANIVRNGPKTFTAPFILYNRTTARAEELSAALPVGLAIVAKSVEDAATVADILFAIVSNDAACTTTVNSIISSPTGIKGKAFVCCSTISPDTTTSLAARVQEAGGAFISMPVFGAVAMAEIAQLVCVPAGRKEDVDRIRPFLTGVIGRSVIDLSDRNLTDALKLKIIGNSFILNAATILADAHVLAEKCGLGDGAVFNDFVTQLFPGVLQGYSERMVKGDYLRKEPPFHVDHARKDAHLGIDLATANGVRLRHSETADAQLAKLQEYANENGLVGDLAQLYGLARVEAGLPFVSERKL